MPQSLLTGVPRPMIVETERSRMHMFPIRIQGPTEPVALKAFGVLSKLLRYQGIGRFTHCAATRTRR